jgi:GH35 family endo-1,4-beta-xylanase
MPTFYWVHLTPLVGWAYEKWIPEWLLKEEANITSHKAKQLLSDYIHSLVGRY